MTDSGGYQVLEYGSINVGVDVIAQFQKDIRSDISVPLDKPTGYGLDYHIAKNYVEQTLTNASDTLRVVREKDTKYKNSALTKERIVSRNQYGQDLSKGARTLGLG